MGARILVIEDNQANLDLMTYLLQAFGHTPLTACDGEDGLACVYRDKPDLIVCDVHLPKLDGCEVSRRLKGDPTFRNIPLVAVTAFAMVGDRDRILSAGFDGYIAKPIVPETFVAQIDVFLAPSQRTPPLSPPNATQVADPMPTVSRVKRGSIMVVDDLPSNLSVLRSMLELSGYEVSEAAKLSDALTLARQTKPDLILSDLNMPGGSGYDLIKLAQADPELRNIPFAFISSTDIGEAEQSECRRLGACRFIVRPIEPQVLLREIEACLAGGGKVPWLQS